MRKPLVNGLLFAILAAHVADGAVVKAYEIPNSSITAELDDAGVLTLTGAGAMPDFERGDDQPWSLDRASVLSVVGGAGITSIGSHAFDLCKKLASVSLPGAATVGESAFNYCTALTTVSLPEAVTIGNNAFTGCSAMTVVSFPKVTTIGESAFSGCNVLSAVSLPNVITIDGNAFQNCTALGSLSLPKATTIMGYAFNGCSALVAVSLPVAESIGIYAFTRCTSLRSVSIPSATTIGASAFYRASNITSVTLGWTLFEHPNRATWGLSDSVQLYPPMTEEEVKGTTSQVVWLCGDRVIGDADYTAACAHYKLEPKTVAQVVGEDEIAVKKEALSAPEIETLKVEGGIVKLGIGVMSNANLRVETKNWKPVELASKDVTVESGRIVVTLPASGESGFMILQSGDGSILEWAAQNPGGSSDEEFYGPAK